MQCPVCRTVDLMMTERQGIEIDYCPTCRGVWLDRGELDKILERSVGLEQPRMEEPRKRRADVPMQYRDDDHYYDDDDKYHQQKRKRGWLGDVFDIFD
jgi:Zn-finger nucleic acid-binding protein